MEIVRWVYEKGFAARTVDVPGAEQRIAADYLFHTRPDFPGRDAYGLDQMVELWADLDETWTDHSLVPERYEPIGPAHVLVTVRQTARLRGSDRRLAEMLYMLWHLTEGKAQETWTATDRDEALKAAGLSEQSMSEDNVEIVRHSTEAYSRGAIDEALASWAPDAVLDWSNSRGLEPEVVRGRDQIRAYMEQFLQAFEEIRIEFEDIFEADTDVVIAENLAYLRGHNGVEVTARSAWIITFQNGRQTSLTLYQSQADALEALGLSE